MANHKSTFTPQAGTWGLQGFVEVPDRPRDYVFFVTFGRKQADHEFDEGITADGVFRWQSQPSQWLADPTIKQFIAHDDDRNSIYLFLRTASRREGRVVPYTYLGRLRYLTHDRDRQKPVYFTWQVLDWDLPEDVRARIHLTYESTAAVESVPPADEAGPHRLVQVAVPTGSARRAGLSTDRYLKRPPRDYAEQDAANRKLGLAGEEAVIENERITLRAVGRNDLAEMVVHVAKVEGDGAGYDIKSYTSGGEQKFIEVKTTRGGEQTPFYVSSTEARFAAEHAQYYYLYRVFEFDQGTSSGKYFISKGDLYGNFSLEPLQFKVVPADGVSRNTAAPQLGISGRRKRSLGKTYQGQHLVKERIHPRRP
jgi:Domain of unknown function (DUF3883)/Domain of unknown function (DUF3427)